MRLQPLWVTVQVCTMVISQLSVIPYTAVNSLHLVLWTQQLLSSSFLFFLSEIWIRRCHNLLSLQALLRADQTFPGPWRWRRAPSTESGPCAEAAPAHNGVRCPSSVWRFVQQFLRIAFPTMDSVHGPPQASLLAWHVYPSLDRNINLGLLSKPNIWSMRKGD